MLTRREIYCRNLPHRAVSVYMYLCDRCNKTGTCFPSIATICEDLKLSRSTVKRALHDLEDAKCIKKKRRYRQKGGNSSNLYILI
mgnify:CR=1